MPNNVDGSVPARVIIDVRSSGSGRSAPRVISSCCIIIWPRAPIARLSPCAAARICSLSTRTDPSIAFSAVNRIGRVGGHPRPQAEGVRRDVSSSVCPPSSMASTPASTSGGDVGFGQPGLELILRAS